MFIIYIYKVHYNTFLFNCNKMPSSFLEFWGTLDRLTTLQPNATFSIFLRHFNPITVAIDERLEVILRALIS